MNQRGSFLLRPRPNRKQESVNFHICVQAFHTILTVVKLLIVVHIFSSWYLSLMTPNSFEVTIFSYHSTAGFPFMTSWLSVGDSFLEHSFHEKKFR